MAYACICHFFVVPLQPQRLINYMATTRQELIEELKGLLEQDVRAERIPAFHAPYKMCLCGSLSI